MTIEAVLRTKGDEVITLTGHSTVAEAISLFTARRIGAAPVMVDGAIVGVFSERDVMQGLYRTGAATLERPVTDLMTQPAMTVTSTDTVLAALALMTERRIRHLPVVTDGRLVGLVSIGDLVKYRIRLIESESASLRDYIQSA